MGEVKCVLDRTTARTPIYILNEPHGPNPTDRQRKRTNKKESKPNPIEKESERTQESKHNDINDTRRHSAAGGRASNLSSQQFCLFVILFPLVSTDELPVDRLRGSEGSFCT
jgi:hypothetical protein